MYNFSTIVYSGVLDSQPCLSRDNLGVEMCSFHMNSQSTYKDKNGILKTSDCPITVCTYGPIMDRCLKYKIGTKLAVNGFLRQNSSIDGSKEIVIIIDRILED